MFDDFGDRLKAYEAVETERRLDITIPIYARLDGRSFSKFTRGLRRPYDERMSAAMIETTKALVEKTDAMIGYTQSDEISLGWHVDIERNPLADMFFGAKVQKLTSVLASLTTAVFTNALHRSEDAEFAAYAEKLPHFDCRIFNVPNSEELANLFLWREMDAVRNAVSMAAFTKFDHLQLHKVNVGGMKDMLAEIGVDFDAFPAFFKRGTFVQRRTRRITLDEATRDAIPAHKRPAEDATFMRTLVETLDMPPFGSVSNRVAVIYGASPEVD